MLAEHLGKRPVVDPEAVIAPTAVISGDVHIGSGSVVLAGAVITSQGAPVRIGQHCIVMENAVIRGAGRYPCTLGNHVLVGPHAHVAGATVNGRAFVATGASVFNGALLEEGVVVAPFRLPAQPIAATVRISCSGSSRASGRGNDSSSWMRTGSQEISGELERRDCLLTLYGGEVVEEPIERVSSGQVIEEVLHWHPSSAKDRRAAENLGVDLHD